MSRNGITQEQVFEAAANLSSNQQPVTVQAVREALGVGSFTTITQHLRKWREQTKPVTTVTAVPPEVEAATSRAVTSIWQVAEDLMRREIETIKQATQYQVHEYQHSFEEALQEIARLERQIQTQTQQIADLHEQTGTLRDALMQSKAHLLAQTSREKDLMNRLDEMKQDLTQARTTVEQKNENCALLRGELAALKADRAPRKGGHKNEENRPQ